MIYITGIIIPVMLAVSIESRSVTDVRPPCYVNDDVIQVKENIPLPTCLESIRYPVLNLKARIEVERAKMGHLCKPTGDDSFIAKRLNAMKYEQTVLIDTFGTNSILIIEAIREHYNILNIFAHYLEEIRKTALDITARKSLQTIQNQVYGVMCAMKIVLRSWGFDPVSMVPSGPLSYYLYESLNQLPDVCLQQKLEYVIVHDGERVIRYLKLYYNNIINLSNK